VLIAPAPFAYCIHCGWCGCTAGTSSQCHSHCTQSPYCVAVAVPTPSTPQPRKKYRRHNTDKGCNEAPPETRGAQPAGVSGSAAAASGATSSAAAQVGVVWVGACGGGVGWGAGAGYCGEGGLGIFDARCGWAGPPVSSGTPQQLHSPALLLPLQTVQCSTSDKDSAWL
jgi:hypothetical protein